MVIHQRDVVVGGILPQPSIPSVYQRVAANTRISVLSCVSHSKRVSLPRRNGGKDDSDVSSLSHLNHRGHVGGTVYGVSRAGRDITRSKCPSQIYIVGSYQNMNNVRM